MLKGPEHWLISPLNWGKDAVLGAKPLSIMPFSIMKFSISITT
jgi:hypothetical protein